VILEFLSILLFTLFCPKLQLSSFKFDDHQFVASSASTPLRGKKTAGSASAITGRDTSIRVAGSRYRPRRLADAADDRRSLGDHNDDSSPTRSSEED
jgi:hypothetical protein